MLRANIYTKNIDYNTIVELLMPYMEKWFSKENNIAYNIFSKVISNKGKPTKFSKFVVSILPNKTDMAASMLPHYEDMIIDYLNNLLHKNNIVARITSINTDTIKRSCETMLRIEIKVDEIDYEKTVDNLLPTLLQKLSEKDDKTGKLANLLIGLQGLPNDMIKAAIGVIPKEQRDDLVAAILSEYKEELSDSFNSIIVKNNLKAEVCEVKVDSI